MDPIEQTKQQTVAKEQEQWIEEGWEQKNAKQETVKEEKTTAKLKQEPKKGARSLSMLYSEPKEDRTIFVNGLSMGLGIGCIATFVIMWIGVFFTPLVPAGATYENLLSIFIYPLIYLLALGLITLTAGIVREYYTPERALNQLNKRRSETMPVE
jgi:hypothetical protein